MGDNEKRVYIVLFICITIILTVSVIAMAFCSVKEKTLAFENGCEEVVLPGSVHSYWQKAKVEDNKTEEKE